MSQEPLTERLGIPRALIWGFIGLAIFMIGDGVETNILEPFLSSEHGFTVSRAGLLVMLYGIAVAIAAFFAAALSDLWGPRRVMALGAGVWVVFELAFLLLALTSSSTTLIFLSYGLRGFGYPLFAYGFLVWITAVSPAEKLDTATSWFYVAFSAGLPTLGALTATVSMAWFNLSFYETLWVSLVLVIIGAACALIGVKERIGRKALVENPEDVSETLGASFKLLIKDRRARFVVYIRTINSIPTYAMAVFFPAYFTERLEWPLAWFLILTTVIYAVNLPFNPFYGRIGDKLGWSKTTVWAGAVSCGVTLALVYFVPMLSVEIGLPDGLGFALTLACGALFGVSLAGFVPLSPIAVSLNPERPGAAMAAYNLGVGGAVAAGPALVAIFYPLVGATGLIFIFLALFAAAAFMAHSLRGTQPGFDGVPAVKTLSEVSEVSKGA
ncbi:MAG TPA: RbtT/DalT/CsbX family MFS transporter [Corynebacterium stationis]|uniref:RbtT/DalT/CsbX family MFS transporter n=1 Tax=Corynebacterium stationis TaxID=1705 RepID=UPI001DEE5CA5|nr:RbtT/DalT/CsbX family MFS transporter [Corynebacterium stationis]HJG63585.1 RbtT/DalT/CsbX family MFS transporter [Corynebacterium stationis]